MRKFFYIQSSETLAYIQIPYCLYNCILLDESVNTLVDNAYSNSYSSNCISRSISHIPCTHSASTMRNGLHIVIKPLAVYKSGEKIEIFVGRHLKFSPDPSCAIRQP